MEKIAFEKSLEKNDMILIEGRGILINSRNQISKDKEVGNYETYLEKNKSFSLVERRL